MDNQQKIIDYFFNSQDIQLTSFHEQDIIGDTVLIVDPREKRNDVCKHQIIKFDFRMKDNSTSDLLATATYIYDNGTKDGMTFSNDFFYNKMKLGQKCVTVLDKLNIKHYYPAIGFNIEMNTNENKIWVKDFYHRINLIRTHGTTFHLLEDCVTAIIKERLQDWEINVEELALTDLIDMYLMAAI